MIKKIAILLLMVLVVISLFACNKGQNDHSHLESEAVVENRVEPTCVTDGKYDSVVYCKDCGEELTRTEVKIDTLGHSHDDAVVENKIDATYENDGSYDEVIYCSTCKIELGRESHTIPMLKHTPGDAIIENKVDSTCYSGGSFDSVVYCTECDTELERTKHTIPVVSHTPAEAVEENRVEPSFEADGSYDMVIYCSVAECHKELERVTYTLDMLEHHPGEAVIENKVDATCYSEGSYDEVVYCLDDNCGHKELSRKSVVVGKTSHIPADPIVENKVEATCYLSGKYEEAVYCSISGCNVEISRKTITENKKPHNMSEWYEVVEVTCKQDGEMARSCTNDGCNYTETELVEAKHIYVDGNCKFCGVTSEEYFIFTLLEDGSYSIKARPSSEVNMPVVISLPCEYNGAAVSTIETYGFSGSKIESITIPSNIKVVEGRAFYNCGLLTDVYITDVVAWLEIQFKASSNASGDYMYPTYYGSLHILDEKNNDVTRVEVPSHITKVNAYAFSGCASLIEVVMSDNVTDVGAAAFMNCTNLKSVVLSDKITKITGSLFMGCSNLESVELSDNITEIGGRAFEQCQKLSEIYIGSKVTSIGGNAFYYCTALKDVYIRDVNSWLNISFGKIYSYSDDYAYPNYYGNIHIVDGQGNEITDVTISEAKQTIGKYALMNATSVERIFIPAGVTDIGDSAFENCTGLLNVTYGEGSKLTSISNSAFMNCFNLREITIPSTVVSIGDKAFLECLSVTELYIPASVAAVGSEVFKNCSLLSKVEFGEGSVLNAIGHSMFMGCTSLVNISIPDGITKVDHNAFEGCTSLVEIVIPYGTERINSRAFKDCKNLKKIDIPDTIIVFERYAFHYCSSLEEIYIPSNLISIAEYAFQYCKNIKNVYVKNIEGWLNLTVSSTEADPHAYGKLHFIDENGYEVTEIVIPESVTTIRQNAFMGTKNVEKISIHNGVTSIGNRAFNNSGIRELDIPSSITVIPAAMASYCSNLERVTFPNSLTSIEANAFANCYNLRNISIPENVKIGSYAFGMCYNLTTAVFGKGVTFSSNPFQKCYKLIEIYNLTDKQMIPGSIIFGEVGEYAKFIHTSLDTESEIKTVGDFQFVSIKDLYSDNITHYLIAYIGSETNLVLPDSYNGGEYHIYKYAFSYSNIESIYITKSVTGVSASAFIGCNDLKHITVDPMNSVYYSEGDCLILRQKNILVRGTYESIIPENITAISIDAFRGCTKLKSIYIPSSVIKIDAHAFFEASSLTDVYYGGSEEQWKQIVISIDNNKLTSANIHYNALP